MATTIITWIKHKKEERKIFIMLNPIQFVKNVKKPISSVEEGNALKKEAIIYTVISGAVFLIPAFIAAASSGSTASAVWTVIAIPFFLIAAYFGLMVRAISIGTVAFQNLHCDKCGTELIYDQNTHWKEANRRWKESSNEHHAEAILYVTVDIQCQCPKCGAGKKFRETLRSGKIDVSSGGTTDTIVDTGKLVNDYFHHMIHK